ncbi:MAG: single-stranded DNA-binding protein [Oscillospiraceae bacterium]
MYYNKIILVGRLTKDPELRTFENGSVAIFSLAIDRDYKSDDGETETDFVDIVAFKGKATFVNKWFKKGMLVMVEGKLQSRRWVDKDGNNRYSANVVADEVRFAEPKKKDTDEAYDSTEDNNS